MLDSTWQQRLDALGRDVAALDTGTPVHAHVRLRTARREAGVFLGNASRTFGEVTVVDWQAAPLAETFFLCDEGEAYEIEDHGRVIAGTVLEKHTLGFERGHLVRVDTPTQSFQRPDAASAWQAVPLSPAPALELRPPEARKPFRSPLEVKLDAAQQRIVDLPPSMNALILGEAGFGKTTVALHRLVALREKNLEFAGAVLVPTEGLRRLTALMLERRGIEDVEVSTYDAWAARLSRREFVDLPKRESATKAAVTALKRHPALRPVLREFAQQRPEPTVDEERPTHSKQLARRADLEHLFGERTALQRVVDAAGGALRQTAVADVAEHTRVQFLDSTETQYAHVDRAALATVDGRAIDDGTPTEDAESVDAEDHAVLFELERLRAEAKGRPGLALEEYDCIVLDEAQEFASIELSLIGRTLKPTGCLIVAGDAAQQVDPSSFFSGWEAAMADLTSRPYERAVLEVNYRCPPDVTALARSIIDPALPRPSACPSVKTVVSPSLFHQAVWLGPALREAQVADRNASIAVICRTAEGAAAFAKAVRHDVSVKMALGGLFDFKPGITVTCVPEVKGLEFDLVVLPDASAVVYPETNEARRALYVAVTRTTHRLTVSTVGAVSSLLQSA